MKLSKITLVLVVALSLAAIAAPAGAQCFGGAGFGVPFGIGSCGFGVPFGIGTGAVYGSSFQTSSSFSTYGTAGFGGLGFGGYGLGGFGLGGFGLGGLGLGGFGLGGFC